MYKWFNRVTLDLPYLSQFSFASIFWPGRFSRNHFFLDNAILRRVTFNFFCWIQVFKTTPTVHVTPHHTKKGRKYDAMLVWIEKVSPSEFEVCLQESRVFDGLHEGLKVVSRYSFYVVVLPLMLFGICFVVEPFLFFLFLIIVTRWFYIHIWG